MGGVLSSSGTKRKACQDYDGYYNDISKRRKTYFSFLDESQRLIPSLPDEISMQILARLPRISYFNLRLVSQKWKETITSPELYQLRKELGLTEEWLYVLTKVEEDKLSWYALDPLSRKWQRLPPMPSAVYAEESWKGSSGLSLWNIMGTSIKLVEFVRGWLGQKGTFDQMPFCGCAMGAVDGYLYVIGGISRTSTMRCAWRYDPTLNQWSEINSMSTSRAHSKTAILGNKLYVVGGLSRSPRGWIPLQSAEVFDPSTGSWSEVPSMPFSSAQVLPNLFLSDMLKPIATGMTTYKGKLYVPQSLYSWPFFVDIGGEMYDPELNSWTDMPAGMGEGWPARQAGTKLSVVVDGELYAVDPSNSAENGNIKVYDQTEDAWKVVIGKLPNYDFTDSESPILLAGFHGKIHVIAKDVHHTVAVMQALPINNFCSSPCSSSVSAFSLLDEHHPSPADSETVVWRDVAHKNFGSVELVNCQVLDI